MADRFSQMSEQAALIARKKAEIEAKRVAALQEGNAKTNSLTGSTSNKPGAFNRTPNAGNSLNKWGFKGKTPQQQKPPVKPPQQQTPVKPPPKPSLVNTFNNDGSFLDQFKRLSEAKKQTPVKAESVTPAKSEPVAHVKPVTQVKPELVRFNPSLPPPAVPEATVEKPPEADAWYKIALERARSIAQSMKDGGPPPVQLEQAEVKPEIEVNPLTVKQEVDEYGSSSTTVQAGPAVPALSDSDPATKSSNEYTVMVKKEEQPFHYDEDEEREPLPIVVQELASMVAVSGDQLEEIARARNVGEEQLAFLQDVECDIYKRYRLSIDSMRRGMDAERIRNKEEIEKAEGAPEKKKSRWSDEPVPQAQVSVSYVMPLQNQGPVPPGASPQLVQYAIRVFGSTDLTEDQWRQCEDQIKMSVVYNEMLLKKQAMEKLAQQGKRKYEYDSDEDIEGGTWEHKARKAEMEKTAREAHQLTEAATGRHHIGDFLPPEELTKFMAKFQAMQRGEEFDESDYTANKLTQDNLGFKMLQRMGWSEGTGLGSDAQGIVTPVGKGSVSSDKKGLGTAIPHDLGKDDDEFDAYRKRMMLAYRFRPNPLNNPRRAYY